SEYPKWLFEPIGTVNIPATTEKFVAKKKLVVNTEHTSSVKIRHIDNSFEELFLWGDGKTEDTITKQILHYAKLRKLSVDDHIIAELGGETKVETTLTEMYFLMEQQPNGEDGKLLTNGGMNIFYIRGIESVLCSVFILWFSAAGADAGWCIYAKSLSDGGWGAGPQIFSRNF
ncbi:MAG: hypothetical protein WCV41_03570, partial [Patescibacteria group bacterium]